MEIKLRFLDEFDELDVINWFRDKIQYFKDQKEDSAERISALTTVFSDHLEKFVSLARLNYSRYLPTPSTSP